MRLTLLALLAGCVDDYELPEVRRLWTCQSTLVCDGVEYYFTDSQYCAPDWPGAEEKYLAAIARVVEQTTCRETSVHDMVCVTSAFAYCS